MTAYDPSGRADSVSWQKVLAALDAVAPWQAVLAPYLGRRAAGVSERDGDVYRVVGDPPLSRLVEAGWRMRRVRRLRRPWPSSGSMQARGAVVLLPARAAKIGPQVDLLESLERTTLEMSDRWF